MLKEITNDVYDSLKENDVLVSSNGTRYKILGFHPSHDDARHGIKLLYPDNETKVVRSKDHIMDCYYLSDYSPNVANDRVSHPLHYTWLKDKCGIEVIDITRHLNFNLGNAIKYILRSGHKKEEGLSDMQKQIEDLKKARFYIDDEIKRLEER